MIRSAIWLLLALWACAVYSRAQLPDAPSASKSVCYQGALDAKGQFMYVEVDCRSLPVAATVTVLAKKPTLLTFNRGTSPFRAKTFDAALVLEAMSTFADAAVTHRRAGQTVHRPGGWVCTEANPELPAQPTNGQLWRQDGIPLAAQTALLYFVGRYTWLPIAWGSFAYGTAIHARGAYSWRNCQ
jgi:hypothetical protein